MAYDEDDREERLREYEDDPCVYCGSTDCDELSHDLCDNCGQWEEWCDCGEYDDDDE